MNVRIETERLVLRMPRLDDADAAAELLIDPEVMRHIGGAPVPREDAAEVVQTWLDRWSANGMGPFAIERREDRRFLGRTGIKVWDRRDWRHTTLAAAGADAQPELGWALARAHWGNGYATEAARAVRDWFRAQRSDERLVSLIFAGNIRSQRVVERMGAHASETVTLFDSGPAVVWVHEA